METIKVGIIGAGWMGHVHARAYQRLGQHWPDLVVRPELVAVADSSAAAAETFARAHGVATQTISTWPDWRELLADPDLAAVSVTAPNFLHREIGVAVAEAGKHLWIEKPVGLTAADAVAVRDAVRASGVVGCVGFNYRNVPAVARARRIVESGRIGVPTHARVQLLTDYAAHPGSPLSWRYAVDRGGHGVLGDLASHGVDLLRFVLGEVSGVMAQTAIHIAQRPVADARRQAEGHYAVLDVAEPGLTFGEVENEDYVVAILRMSSGSAGGLLAVCEADRAAVGEQNNYALEVHGTRGLVRWDFRRPGELQVAAGDQYAGQPTSTVFSEPGDGEYAAFQPGAGIAMGYDDTKVVEARSFVRAIAGEVAELATLDDAVASATVLDAMVASHTTGQWVDL
jgi:predicted dehydrogenase